MKRIIISLAVVGAVAAAVVVGTTAFFSDTEKSTGNTFSAGTIDIAIDQQNPWDQNYTIGDLKPGETGYINFDITNKGTNPVDVSKTLTNITGTGGAATYDCKQVNQDWNYSASSEPECVAEAGAKKDDVQTQIIYDLSVKVYLGEGEGNLIWWQAIYEGLPGETLAAIYGAGQYVNLGMIPVGGHMKVTQSYHFNPNADNEYQGDGLIFNMEIKGTQLTGENGYASVVLENKTGPTAWDIIQDGISGTLNYKTHGSKFEYSLSGKAPLTNHGYVLAVGYNASTDVDTYVGQGVTDGNGDILFSGSVDLNENMVNAKAWLVPAENWSGGMVWTGWPSMVPNILWETGLINYDDIDL